MTKPFSLEELVARIRTILRAGVSERALRGRRFDMRATHEAIALATIAMIAVHALALLGDAYLNPSFADVTVPLASDYNRLWTTTGIVAGWGTAVLGLSYYARRWVGQQRWRSLHSLTALTWLLGVAHSIGEGTDAGRTWFLALVAIAVAPTAVLLFARAAAPPGPARGGAGAVPVPAARVPIRARPPRPSRGAGRTASVRPLE